MNIVCVVVNMVAINTYGVAMFSLDQFPDWANSTLACAPLEPNATLATTWTPTLAHYSTYSSKELLPVVCRLALALTKRDDSKLKVKIFSTL